MIKLILATSAALVAALQNSTWVVTNTNPSWVVHSGLAGIVNDEYWVGNQTNSYIPNRVMAVGALADTLHGSGSEHPVYYLYNGNGLTRFDGKNGTLIDEIPLPSDIDLLALTPWVGSPQPGVLCVSDRPLDAVAEPSTQIVRQERVVAGRKLKLGITPKSVPLLFGGVNPDGSVTPIMKGLNTSEFATLLQVSTTGYDQEGNRTIFWGGINDDETSTVYWGTPETNTQGSYTLPQNYILIAINKARRPDGSPFHSNLVYFSAVFPSNSAGNRPIGLLELNVMTGVSKTLYVSKNYTGANIQQGDTGVIVPKEGQPGGIKWTFFADSDPDSTPGSVSEPGPAQRLVEIDISNDSENSLALPADGAYNECRGPVK